MVKKTKKQTIKNQPAQDLTASNLKNLLWETLQGIKNGKIEAKDGNAVAAQSREICRVQKMQIDAMKVQATLPKKDRKLLV